jgi:hypothetical protein
MSPERLGQQSSAGRPIHASPAASPETNGGLPLHEEQIRSWRENGFALVDGLFALDLIELARAESMPFFPSPRSDESEAVTDYGSGGAMEFPTPSNAINEITLDPRLLGAVSQLLGVHVWDLRLTQSEPWAKYGRVNKAGGRFDNQDQRMHVDYPNHTLTHPADWDRPEAVSILLYFDTVEQCGGATEFVPREGHGDLAYEGPLVRTPGLAGLEFVNDRGEAAAYLRDAAPDTAQWREENLYARARAVHYQPGTVLFYRQDLWHRGTPLRPGAVRLIHNMTFRRKECDWISTVHQGWAWAMYRSSKVMVKLLAEGSVEQRCVLGFPEPGHSYWTRGTLDAVRARLGPWGLDMGPYETAWSGGANESPDNSFPPPGLDRLRQENASLREELSALRARLAHEHLIRR